MSSPQEPVMIELGVAATGEPEAGEPRKLGRWRWRADYAPRALAALGAAALFASLVGEWLTTSIGPSGGAATEAVTSGLEAVGAWGLGWVVGVLVVSTAVGLALLGPVQLRAAARAVGLAVTGASAGLLAAASVRLSRTGILFNVFIPSEEVEVTVTLERGMYAGYAGLALLAAALWLASSPVRPETAGATPQERAVPASGDPVPADAGDTGDPGRGDIEVAEATPVAYPDERHELR